MELKEPYHEPSAVHLLAKLEFNFFFFKILFSCSTFPKQALIFTCLQYKSVENTVGKGEIARNEQFLIFPQCFLPVLKPLCRFYQF